MPAPGGDLIRNPDVLPTGRNMHALDLFDPSPLLPLKSPRCRPQASRSSRNREAHTPNSIAFTSGN
jgi:magnesium chelatase subunit H